MTAINITFIIFTDYCVHKNDNTRYDYVRLEKLLRLFFFAFFSPSTAKTEFKKKVKTYYYVVSNTQPEYIGVNELTSPFTHWQSSFLSLFSFCLQLFHWNQFDIRKLSSKIQLKKTVFFHSGKYCLRDALMAQINDKSTYSANGCNTFEWM